MIEAHSDVLYTAAPEHSIHESSLSVRPNPATDFIDVFVEQKDRQAEMIDLSGKTVKNIQLNNEVSRIVISDLPKGVYVLRVNGETRKFVKQ